MCGHIAPDRTVVSHADGSRLLTFLSPIPALIGAAVALPALLLLYFLKLRRRELRIPTTMLWVQSIEDLEANAPFQRLKPSLLFWLQLLIVLSLLLALARPTRESAGGDSDADRVILMIDVSASMQALIRKGQQTTRFDRARQVASNLLDRLGRGSRLPQVMLMAVGYRTDTVVSWTADLSEVRQALADLRVRDEPARFGPALQLANIHAQSSLASQGGTSVPSTAAGSALPVHAVLISDGRFADEDPVPAASGDLAIEFICIGDQERTPAASDKTDEPESQPAVDNAGIVTLAAARAVRSEGMAEVLAVIANAGSTEVRVPVRVDIAGTAHAARIVDVPPVGSTAAGKPGLAAAQFEVPLIDSAVVRVTLAREDQLALDNSAAIVLQAGLPISIVTVSPSGRPLPLLRDLLDLLDVNEVDDLNASDYEQQASSGALDRYTMAIFDGYTPRTVPPLPSLSFGGCPPLPVWRLVPESNAVPDGDHVAERSLDQLMDAVRVLSWERMHALMSSVGLDSLVVTDPHRLALPEPEVVGTGPGWSTEPLALAPDGVLMALARRNRLRHIAVSFSLLESNWPIDPGFAIFVRNAVEYLTESQRASAAGSCYTTTQPVNFAAGRHGNGMVRIDGPGGQSINVDATEGVGSVPALPSVGLYTVTGQGETTPVRTIAVNLLSDIETDIRPVTKLEVQGKDVTAMQASQATRHELWPWFVGFAVTGLFLEWLLYTRRASL